MRSPVGASVAAAVLCSALGAGHAAEPARDARPEEMPAVEVIGTTPLEGIGVEADRIAANVQRATAEALERQRSVTVADFMEERLASVHVNEAQSNPFQPDVSFRGFSASPLLGNPIGLSVFIDGVRVNESFGDTVLWDLIPGAAIASIDLYPGAPAAFGLNTLGAALTLRTKSGLEHPGVSAALGAGSFGRRTIELTAGAATDSGVHGLLALHQFEEDGWRDHSPSRVRQLFARAGWEAGATRLSASYTLARNSLVGNGLVPESLLRAERDSVYTHPDQTEPELDFLTLRVVHAANGRLTLSGNLYGRWLAVRTFNGDAEFDDGDSALDPADDAYEAENRRTRTVQRTAGAALELALIGRALGAEHRLALGVSHDRGRTEFRQLEQEARFTGDRGTIGEGGFELDTAVRGSNSYDGIYLSDAIALGDGAHLTLAGRYNRARLRIRDRSGAAPELNGAHAYSRFNPAVGLTATIAPRVFGYIGYSEGFRVPTPVELTCADPQDPCALPVGFVADPPLRPVVARSWEAGFRGRAGGTVRWVLGGFRTALDDDLLFTATGASRGFFANVPGTRRAGLELALEGRGARLDWSLKYSRIEATFRSAAQLFNPVAQPADTGTPATIEVSKGDRLPGVPRHLLKVSADAPLSPQLSVGLDLSYVSSSPLRGDEGNEQEPLAGYALAGLRASCALGDAFELFARIDNLLDRRYASLGALNRNAFDASGAPLEGQGPGRIERFLSPGAPRHFRLGIRYTVPAERH